MEYPDFSNIRKVTVGNLKEGMTYLVGGFQRGGKVKVTRIIPFDSMAFHTNDRVLMLSVYVQDVKTQEEYKWFDLSFDEISKIEYFESNK